MLPEMARLMDVELVEFLYRYLEEGKDHITYIPPNGKELEKNIDSNCVGWDPGYVIVPRRVKRCVKRVSKYVKPI